MAKRWYRCYRAKQDGELAHLLEHLHAHQVTLDPGIEERVGRVSGFADDPRVELFQDRTEFRFISARHGTEQHASSNAEEFPPQFASGFEALGPERAHVKASAS